MNPEIKDKWVKALRSGEYHQGRSSLRTDLSGDKRFCCLGVLCDIYNKEENLNDWINESYETSSLSRVYGFHRHTAYLPPTVMAWAGLVENDPVVRKRDDWNTTLSTLNDTGNDFATIAQAIEDNL